MAAYKVAAGAFKYVFAKELPPFKQQPCKVTIYLVYKSVPFKKLL